MHKANRNDELYQTLQDSISNDDILKFCAEEKKRKRAEVAGLKGPAGIETLHALQERATQQAKKKKKKKKKK